MRKRTLVLLAVPLLLLVAAGFFADRKLKGMGHAGLRVFVGQLVRNYPKSFRVEPPVLRINVDEESLARLQAVVDAARERGIIMPEGNDYVQADVEGPEGAFKARVRIKGKMSDHVEGDKWSFRVIGRKDGGFMGMKRFSLQHPGTRNYLSEWFYHQLMRGEGLVTLRYGFCKVVFNDEDLGVYAYEEHFGPQLLENNQRLEGPLVRFEPGLFWEHRLLGAEGFGFQDGFGDQEAANLDAFGTGGLRKDAEANRQFEDAVAVMERFRRGELPAHKAFDPVRTAKRLALLDLLGGHSSMDWSDVKFYFDPLLQRFEPVSYESVSGRRIEAIAGAFRVSGPPEPGDDFHVRLLKDSVIFAAYIAELERLSAPAWLDSAFAALEGPLDTASATLYGEFPYKEFDRSVYLRNQGVIARALQLPKGYHAYAQGLRKDTLHLVLVPLNNLPVNVEALVLPDGRKLPALRPVLVPSRKPGRTGTAVDAFFLVPGISDSLLMKEEFKVEGRIPGASRTVLSPVFPQRWLVDVPGSAPLAKAPNVHDFPFLHVDAASRTISTRPGSWAVDRDIVLPEGYTWSAAGPLELRLAPGKGIMGGAVLDWLGRPDAPIRVSGTADAPLLTITANGGRSRLHHVQVSVAPAVNGEGAGAEAIRFHGADVDFQHLAMEGSYRTGLHLVRNAAVLRACVFGGGYDQLRLSYARTEGDGCRFLAAGDDAITVQGGGLSLANSAVEGAAGVGVKAATGAMVVLTACELRTGGTAVEAEAAAYLNMDAGLLDAPRAAHAGKAEVRSGSARISLNGVRTGTRENSFKTGKGSTITRDGTPVPNTGKAEE